MPQSIHSLNQLIEQHNAGRLDLITLKAEVERERAEREREAFLVHNGFHKHILEP